ncbi:MAG TPA: 5-formyltetrahydrofolate cyclo-ligase [Casimicrobiaceae bacterium]|nr:5-formyltetrahydrofolate cyclo-ligase [Casimicrobiaceae bacterium]
MSDAPARPFGASLRDAKQALRTNAIAARDALSPQFRAEASQAIAARIVRLASFADARTILLNLPFRSEWDTRLLAYAALDAGKTLVIPRVDPLARMLVLHRVSDPDADVAPGYRMIPEPLVALPRVEPQGIEWVLVPGVAFDLAGRRLGYGGGYYDRLLPTLPRTAHRVAGAFEAQVVDLVPAAPHDVDIDCLVTEQRVVDIVPDG